jgi:hypothetical protein
MASNSQDVTSLGSSRLDLEAPSFCPAASILRESRRNQKRKPNVQQQVRDAQVRF